MCWRTNGAGVTRFGSDPDKAAARLAALVTSLSGARSGCGDARIGSGVG
jgi:hypothetical protein